jgi:hypothetical protein
LHNSSKVVNVGLDVSMKLPRTVLGLKINKLFLRMLNFQKLFVLGQFTIAK